MPRDESSDEDMEEQVAAASASSDHDEQSSVDSDAQIAEEEEEEVDDSDDDAGDGDDTRMEEDTGTADAASSEESSEEHTKDVEMVTAGPRATAEPDGKNPLLDGAVRATESFDVQAKRWGKASDFGYLYFDHWKHRLTHKSNYTRLRFTLEELLPRVSVDH